MLVEVEIKNFQAIEHVKFKIEGFTVITGQTNIGKSSVVRAIRAALTGAPSDNYVRHTLTCPKKIKGNKTCKCYCSVRLISDGLDLLWEKGDTVNRYVYNGTEYTVPGRGSPEFLDEKYKPAKLSGEQVLLQVATGQFKPLFLLDESGIASAEILSDVVKLDQVNLALKFSEKTRKDHSATRKVREKDALATSDKLDSLSTVDTIVGYSERLNVILSTAEKTEASLFQLEKFLNELSVIQEQVEKLSPILNIQVTADFQGLQLKHTHWQQGVSLLTGLSTLVSELKQIKNLPKDVDDLPDLTGRTTKIKTLSKFDRLLSTLNQRELDKKQEALETAVIPNVEDLRPKVNSFTQLRLFLSRFADAKVLWDVPEVSELPELSSKPLTQLVSWQTSLHSVAKEVKTLSADLEQLDKESDRILRDIDDLGVCPTCNRPLTLQHLEVDHATA